MLLSDPGWAGLGCTRFNSKKVGKGAMKIVTSRHGGPMALICVYCGCIFFRRVDGKARLRTDTGTGCSTDCASMIRLVSPLTKFYCVVARRLVHGSHHKGDLHSLYC